MAKHIMVIHGRDFKPAQVDLERNWFEAIRHGLERDFDMGMTARFDAIAHKSMIYYGDISNKFLNDIRRKHGKDLYNVSADTQDRLHVLNRLKNYSASEFNKENYNHLRGKSSWQEALADTLGEALEFLHLGKPLIEIVAPDMGAYWNHVNGFDSKLRARLTTPLKAALARGDDVLLIAHSLGSLVAYDTLWKLSHYGEHEDVHGRKINMLLTIGTPLSDETSKRQLKGADREGLLRYPHNIRHWVNFAAEDDYVAHDECVRNDFIEMEDLNLLESHIVDNRIYNLAVRKGKPHSQGKSNPHHSTGYLIHPELSKVVAAWLDGV